MRWRRPRSPCCRTTGKGLLTGELPAQLIAAAREAGRTVIVDPKGPDYSRYAGADIIMPNRTDLAEATGMPVDGEAAVVAAATALRQRHGFGAVLVTRRNDGMTLLDAGGAQHFPAEAAEVYDIAGAGDTAVATLAAGLAARLELPVAVRLANIAAGVVVGKIGTAVAREADLLVALSPQGGALRKIVSREAAVEHVQRWHHKGWRVGFTHGRFDPLLPADLHLAGGGARGLRPAGGRAEIAGRRRNPAGGRPRRHAGEPRLRRSGHCVRGGYAGCTDRRVTTGHDGDRGPVGLGQRRGSRRRLSNVSPAARTSTGENVSIHGGHQSHDR